MRLLLRRDAHRIVADTHEVAASPDTSGREVWQWHVRVTPLAHPYWDADTAATILRADGSTSLVVASADPDTVRAEAVTLDVSDLNGVVRLDRFEGEIVVIVAGAGPTLVEGRHVLHDLEAMILAGDDPLSVSLTRASRHPSSVAVVRLRATQGDLAWVP